LDIIESGAKKTSALPRSKIYFVHELYEFPRIISRKRVFCRSAEPQSFTDEEIIFNPNSAIAFGTPFANPSAIGNSGGLK
jgi:hypothetical protein